MSSEQKFKTMLEMQIAINDLTVPGWKEKNLAWHDAIWIECAELMDHIGWKWWKKQEPNLEQAKMEVVDIWHFGMSMLLSNSTRNIDEMVSYILSREQHLEMGKTFPPLGLTRDVAATSSAQGYFDLSTFFRLCGSLGMSLDDLYTMYVGKNVLNKFRQDNGYKEGRYIKDWLGEEDNEYLEKTLRAMDPNDTTFADGLYLVLKARYDEVKAVREVMTRANLEVNE